MKEEEERQEEARAIAEVEAFNAREAEQSRSFAGVIILEKARSATAAAAAVDLG
jgi:hypothetical protein